MWEQYKKTFWPTQIAIGLISAGVIMSTHAWNAGAVFFVVMQMGGILGAIWGVRLRTKILKADAFSTRGS